MLFNHGSTDNLKLHITYSNRQFSLSVANSSDISIQYLYSSLSINIKTGCSDQNRNWCVVGTVGGTESVTGERYGRESVGTIAIAAIDIQHYTLTGVLWGVLRV